MSRKSSRRRSAHNYQTLESRQMLASITALETGEVRVLGNNTADVIRLIGSSDFKSFTVSINNDPSLTESFAYADVTNVTVFANAGNDTVANTLLLDTFIYGGDGDDILQGGFLNDLLSGNDGADILNSRNGNDLLNGGAGNDRLFGGNGEDRLFGFDGEDRLIGGNDDDFLTGGNGDDTLFGNAGNDLLNGNDDNDFISAGIGDDTANGGQGIDVIIGVGGTNTLNGNGGNDRIFGGNGRDDIQGGSGDDRLLGRAGGDSLSGDAGADVIFGGDDDDALIGGAGEDFLYGQDGDDLLAGDDFFGVDDGDADIQFGNDGDDLFFGINRNDRVNGGAGVDGIFAIALGRGDIRLDRSGSNFITTDLRIPAPEFRNVGQVTLTSIETFQFSGEDDSVPFESLLSNPIVERVFVQPIIVSDDDGSNTAFGFGNAEQEAEFKQRVNRIYNQAGVEVVFLSTNHWNNTFANGDRTVERDVSEVREIITRGDAAGVGSSDPLVLDYYFINRVPGGLFAGRAFLDDNGAVQQATSDSSVRAAETFAHEIGHNFGLSHTTFASLLGRNTSVALLTDAQIRQVLNSRFTQPIDGSSNDTAAGISSAVAGDTGEAGGCGCGVCGLCTGVDIA